MGFEHMKLEYKLYIEKYYLNHDSDQFTSATRGINHEETRKLYQMAFKLQSTWPKIEKKEAYVGDGGLDSVLVDISKLEQEEIDWSTRVRVDEFDDFRSGQDENDNEEAQKLN